MVTTIRTPAPAVSVRRVSPTSVLAELFSRIRPRRVVHTADARARHHRVRQERLRQEERTLRTEIAMISFGVRR